MYTWLNLEILTVIRAREVVVGVVVTVTQVSIGQPTKETRNKYLEICIETMPSCGNLNVEALDLCCHLISSHCDLHTLIVHPQLKQLNCGDCLKENGFIILNKLQA